MSWEFAASVDAGQRAALHAGKAMVHLCPPAGWCLLPVVDALPRREGLGLIALAADSATADDLAASLRTLPDRPPVHVATGLTRTAALLAAGRVGTLVITPPDLTALLTEARIRLADVPALLVAWPEAHLSAGYGNLLDTVFAEARRAARIVATWDETAPAIKELIERHAHRAPVGGAPAPEGPLGPARYVVASPGRRRDALRQVLDLRNPEAAVVWDPLAQRLDAWRGVDPGAVRVTSAPAGEPADLAVAVEFPTPEAFRALREAAGDVIVLLAAPQVGALERLASPLHAIELPGEADHARDRARARRERLRRRLGAGHLDGELLALAPLFEQHDPALVAAAALALAEDDEPPETGLEDLPAFVRLHLGVGRKDQLRPGDVVGALLNRAGLRKESVGRVDIRDSFSLVEVRAADARAALEGLNGARLKGRSVAARFDRV